MRFEIRTKQFAARVETLVGGQSDEDRVDTHEETALKTREENVDKAMIEVQRDRPQCRSCRSIPE